MKMDFLKNSIFVLSLLMSNVVFSWPRYASLNGIKKRLSYQKKCQAISMLHSCQTMLTLAHHICVQKTAEDVKNYCAQQKAAIKNYYENKEVLILDRLGKEIGCDEQQWNLCLENMHYYIDRITGSTKNVEHKLDDIPDVTMQIIDDIFKDNNINMNEVAIESSVFDNSVCYGLTKVALEMKKEYYFLLNNDEKLTEHQEIDSISIQLLINKNMFTLSDEYQRAIIAHEAQHIALKHGFKCAWIQFYLQSYCPEKVCMLYKTTAFNDLLQVYEEQAEIYAALQNPVCAKALLSFRKRYSYPRHNLFEDHYYVLSCINMIWNIENRKNTFFAQTKKLYW